MKLFKKEIAADLLLAFFGLQGGAIADANLGREAEIIHDVYGISHVYADSIFGLFYGYGCAAAQDHIYPSFTLN